MGFDNPINIDRHMSTETPFPETKTPFFNLPKIDLDLFLHLCLTFSMKMAPELVPIARVSINLKTMYW